MANKLKKLIKKQLQKVSLRRYHRSHKEIAEELLNSIESEKGKTNPLFKKLSYEYSQDVFGNKCYAPWLIVYAAITGDFIAGWIPDNYYGKIVVPYKSGFYGIIPTGVKSLSSKLLHTPYLPDRAYYVSGLFFTSSWEVIPREQVKDYIFSNNDKVVFKEDISYQGQGVYLFTKETFDVGKIYNFGNGVFQSYIYQHPFFSEIMPDSVATLRLTTVIEDSGKPSCRAAIMRFGRHNDTHCKWAADIKIPVDVKTGKLNETGYLPNWKTLTSHPDTNVVFKGKVIPKYNACVAYALQMHLAVPFSRSIGWDLIVNENEEVQLMEFNGGHNDIKFSEATQGPCFADLGWEKLWKKKL